MSVEQDEQTNGQGGPHAFDGRVDFGRCDRGGDGGGVAVGLAERRGGGGRVGPARRRGVGGPQRGGVRGGDRAAAARDAGGRRVLPARVVRPVAGSGGNAAAGRRAGQRGGTRPGRALRVNTRNAECPLQVIV